MKSKKRFLKIAIDSPAAAGAGTIAKKISKYYNLFYLDTGKIYRMIANIKLKFPKKFNEDFFKKKINNLNLRDLQNKKLINDEVGAEAAAVSKRFTQLGMPEVTLTELASDFTTVKGEYVTRFWLERNGIAPDRQGPALGIVQQDSRGLETVRELFTDDGMGTLIGTGA